MAEWVEIGLVAKELGRSLYTVDGWARKGRGGRKLGKRRRGSRKFGRTMVDMEMARVMDSEARRFVSLEESVCEKGEEVKEESKPPVKVVGRKPVFRGDVVRESDDGGKWDYNDTLAKVVADRKRWVRDWVEQDLPLGRVLSIFNPHLHAEIEAYYHRAKHGEL